MVTPDAPAAWVLDPRGEGRAVRVASHVEAGFLVVSTWKADVCVGTVRLLPEEAAQLVAGITDGLARLATAPPGSELADRVAGVETRLLALEQVASTDQA